MRYDVGRFRRPMRRSTEGQLASLVSLGDGSTLTLDFTTGILDSRLSFSRLSTATFINSSGLVQWADANLFYNSTWTDANNTPSGWFVGTGTASRSNETRTFTTSASTVYITQTRSTDSGIRYSTSVEVTAVTGSQRVDDVIVALGGSSYQYYFNGSAVSGTTSLTPGIVGLAFTAGAATTTVRVGSGVQGTNTTGAVTLRYPQFEPGTVASRIYRPNSSTTSSYQAPRFDHDPTTLAPRGLLIEGSATNLLKYSAYADTRWIAYGGYTKAYTTGITSPAGDTSAVRVTFAAVGNGLYTNNTQMGYTNSVGATYTFSAWIRATSATTNAKIRFGDSAVATGPDIPISTTWTRYSYQYTALSNSGPLIQSASGTATGEFEMWGMQLEAGSGASSYIPTGASTATRAADSCVMTGTNFSSWFAGATEGVLYAEHERPRSESGSTIHDHAVVGSRYTSGGLLSLYVTGIPQMYPTSLLWPTGGAIFPGGLPSAVPANTKAAARWFDGNDATNFSNGVQGTTGNGSGTVTPTMLCIGAHSTDGLVASRDFLNACVRQVKFWPVALPNSQIIALTTP